jgi:hypothetical protein
LLAEVCVFQTMNLLFWLLVWSVAFEILRWLNLVLGYLADTTSEDLFSGWSVHFWWHSWC